MTGRRKSSPPPRLERTARRGRTQTRTCFWGRKREGPRTGNWRIYLLDTGQDAPAPNFHSSLGHSFYLTPLPRILTHSRLRARARVSSRKDVHPRAPENEQQQWPPGSSSRVRRTVEAEHFPRAGNNRASARRGERERGG